MPVKGISEFSKKIKNFTESVRKVEGTHSVSMIDLLNPHFVSKKTRFLDLDELSKAGGFNFDSVEEFEKIPQEKLDAFIASESEFSDWQELIKAAGEEWIRKQISI